MYRNPVRRSERAPVRKSGAGLEQHSSLTSVAAGRLFDNPIAERTLCAE